MATSYWDRVPADIGRLASPLSPCQDDVRLAQRAMARAANGSDGPGTVLFCGVTRALTTAAWPHARRMIAVDIAEGMIRSVWPGQTADWLAVQADWRRLPLADSSVDYILGDGSVNQFTQQELPEFLASLRRVLCPRGVFILRAFLSPDPRETVEQVLDDLHAGRIGSFHAFKLRLNMAMQDPAEGFVRVSDVYDRWTVESIDEEALASRTGWPIEDIRTIRLYRGADSRFGFPCLAELLAAMQPYFEPVSLQTPSYHAADLVPTQVFRPALQGRT